MTVFEKVRGRNSVRKMSYSIEQSDRLGPNDSYHASQSLTLLQSLIWIDFARVIAIYLVVLLHVTGLIAPVLHETPQNLRNYGYIAFSAMRAISASCVPLLVMISGFLLLDPTKKYRALEFYKRRGKRLMIPLFFWSGFYILWSRIPRIPHLDGAISWSAAAQRVFSQGTYYHLWFLYMIGGLYLITPPIRAVLSRSMPTLTVRLLILLFSVAYIFEVIRVIFSIEISSYLWAVPYLAYFVGGHVLGRLTSPYHTLTLTLSFMLLLSASVIVQIMFSHSWSEKMSIYASSPLFINTVLMTMTLFLIIKQNARFLSSKKDTVGKIAALAFGIYLVHPVVIELLNFVGISAALSSPILSSLGVTTAVFCLSAVIMLIVSRAPYLKNVVF